MLDFFRNVAQSIPAETDGIIPVDPGSRDESSRRAGIIVLREDLDFYAIPPKQDIDQPEMIDVKRAAAQALLRQDGIFSGLKKSDEPGTTEAHLIEMLTAGYVLLPPLPPFGGLFIPLNDILTIRQRFQPRRPLGPPRGRAQQGRHLLARPRAAALRHPRQRGRQQRRRHGAEAAAVLAQARAPLLVGGRRARGRRGPTCWDQVEGVDSQGVDAGDERYWIALRCG